MGGIREEIETCLKKNKYCVLCTCSQDEPRATPVMYQADGLNVMVYSENFTAKFKYLKKNPRVALSFHTTRKPLKGLQLWGRAEVITHKDPRHEAHLPRQAKNNPKLKEACKVLNLVMITPTKIVMFDQARKGAHYLLWKKALGKREIEREIKSVRDLE